jgi:molybdopterin converting factor small subunit
MLEDKEQEFASKLNTQIKEIASDYESRLTKSIAEKVQELKRTYALNLSRERARLSKQHEQEMANAVAKTTQKLHAKYKQEIDELKLQNEMDQKQAQLVISATRQIEMVIG